MFRKVLGYGAFAIGGFVAVKIVAGLLGMVLGLLMQVLFVAIAVAALFAIYKFVSALFAGSSTTTEDVEVEIEVEEEEDDEDSSDDSDG